MRLSTERRLAHRGSRALYGKQAKSTAVPSQPRHGAVTGELQGLGGDRGSAVSSRPFMERRAHTSMHLAPRGNATRT
jgi:hypothetical protein